MSTRSNAHGFTSDGVPRMFIAIPAGCKVVDDVAAKQRKVVSAHLPDGVQFTREPAFHLTLRFLGNVNVDQILAIVSELQQVATRYDPFQLNLYRMGMFAGSNAIWAGIGGDVDVLTELQGSTEAAVRRLGLPAADFPFHPHVTIGRINGVTTEATFDSLRTTVRQQEFYSPPFDVVDFVLYESVMTPAGPVYVVKRRMLLQRMQRTLEL